VVKLLEVSVQYPYTGCPRPPQSAVRLQHSSDADRLAGAFGECPLETVEKSSTRCRQLGAAILLPHIGVEDDA